MIAVVKLQVDAYSVKAYSWELSTGCIPVHKNRGNIMYTKGYEAGSIISVVLVSGVGITYTVLRENVDHFLSFCSLFETRISNEGASALAGALQVNQSLLTLE